MSAPKITAKSAAVYDLVSKEVIFEKNASDRIPPASTVKLLTAMVVLDTFPVNKKMKVPSSVKRISPYKLYLKEGETYTVLELLEALLLKSANDAAHVLAVRTKGSEQKFATLMNKKAKELNALNSHFCNPHGLPNSRQHVTAKDMCLIVAESFNYPVIVDILKTKTKNFPGPGNKKTKLVNRNKLLIGNYKPLVLGKTGYTHKAGRCFAGFLNEGKTKTVIVVFNSPRRWEDLKKLSRWSMKFYRSRIQKNRRLLSHETIRLCQKFLKRAGFLNGEIDGIFGTQTLAAVLRYQSRNNLKVDGILGPRTLKQMEIF